MYKTSERIGASKTGIDGKMKFISAIDMLQDCSQLWMESEPAFDSYLKNNNIGQFLIFRQVDILERPVYGDQVSVCTSIFECKNFFGYRNTAMYNSKGEPCVLSWSVGAFVNLETNRPQRLPPEVLESIIFDDKIEMQYLHKKISLPDLEHEVLPQIPIWRSDIDMYRHVNNARYIDAALELLPHDFEPQRMRVEYKKPARAENSFHPKRIKASGDLYYILLADNENQPYIVAEFAK